MPATGQLKHTWATVVKNDTGASTLEDSQTILGSNEFNEKISIPAGATAEIDCGSLDFASMVSLFLVCDQACTVFTNAADGTGGQEIDLAANKAYAWNNLMPTDNPITADITKIFCTNNAVKDGTFRAGFLLNLLA